jgi:acyl carrier protein
MLMPFEEIRSTMHDFILQRFPAAHAQGLSPDDLLLDLGIVDSLGVLEIITFIERKFGVALTDEEMTAGNFASVTAMAGLVERKLGTGR